MLLRKPTAVATWQAYETAFKENGTRYVQSEFLAALAHTESTGNPWATPTWRWRWQGDVTRLYAPASSATGLLQFIDSTFDEAKRFCIQNGQVVTRQAWNTLDGCWFNAMYTRLSAADSIEMAAARLHYLVEKTLGAKRAKNTQPQDLRRLAAVIHLCGATRGRQFAKGNLSFKVVSRCGSHSVPRYVGKLERFYQQIRKAQ